MDKQTYRQIDRQAYRGRYESGKTTVAVCCLPMLSAHTPNGALDSKTMHYTYPKRRARVTRLSGRASPRVVRRRASEGTDDVFVKTPGDQAGSSGSD